jgi:protease I
MAGPGFSRVAMGNSSLNGKRIIVLAEDRYQVLELWYPLIRLREAGAKTVVVGPKEKHVYKSGHGYEVTTDMSVDEIRVEDCDAVIVPGGYAPDLMRRNQAMVNLVREAYHQGKVVAAICHAGWMLASADIVRGKRLTSYFSIKDDMINAGADWVDEAVVRDGQLITSRSPDDLPLFCQQILLALSEQQTQT